MRLHKIYIIVATVLLLLLVAAGVAMAQTVAPQDASASPDATGNVRIVKTVPSVSGVAAEIFDFSVAGVISDTFTLTAPGSATQRTKIYSGTSLGIWEVTEAPELGWKLTSITCSQYPSGAPTVLPYTVDLDDGKVTFQLTQDETIQCTFNNVKVVDIFVGKYLDKNADTFITPPDDVRLGGWVFNLYDANGNLVSTGTSTTVGDTKLGNQVPAGRYSVCEVLPSGWYANWATVSGGSGTTKDPLPTFGPGEYCVERTFAADDSYDVAFGNVRSPEIRIVKKAVPADPAATFAFTQTLVLDPATPIANNNNLAADQWIGVKCPVGTVAVSGQILTGIEAQSALWVPGASVVVFPNTYNYPTPPPGGSPMPTFGPGETGFIAQKDSTAGQLRIRVNCEYPTGPTPFTLTGANNATAQKAFTGLTVGATNVFEEADPGPEWALTGLACVGGGTIGGTSPQVEVTPTESGQVITCTYTNTRNGKIIVRKTTNPSPDPDDKEFGFTVNYTGTLTLKDGEQNVSDWLTPGLGYTVEENNPGGAWLVTYGCVSANGTSTITKPAARQAAITLGAGDTVTCDYLNTKKGTIEIVKKAIGGGGTFDFSGTGGLGSFQLAPTSTITDSKVFANKNPGTYVVTEAAESGWYLSNLTCVDPSGNSTVDPATGEATIVLDPAEKVICTYENTRLGIIRVYKETVPVGASQTFTFTVTGGPDSVNILLPGVVPNNPPNQWVPGSTGRVLKPGTYQVTEEALPDWDMTGVTCDNGSIWPAVTVAAGERVDCTVENTQRGKIIVEKRTVPAGLLDVFSFTTTGPDYAPFTLTDDEANDSGYLVPELYSVTEDDPGADWRVALTCEQPNANTANLDSSPAGTIITPGGSIITTTVALRKAEIALAPGDEVTCIYTNRRLAEIEAYKYRDLGATGAYDPLVDELLGGWEMSLYRKAGTGWLFEKTLTTDATGKAAFKSLIPADYAVCETQKPGWQNSDPGSAGMVPGLAGICKEVPGVKYGDVKPAWFGNYQARLTIVKVTIPAEDPQPFNFSGTFGPFTLDTNSADPTYPDRKTEVVQPASFYMVKEENAFVAPWNLQNINCQFSPVGSGNWQVSGGDTLLVTVPAGVEAVCTFTNVKAPPPPPACALYDFNNDGMIDIIDLGMVAARWMNPALYDVRFDVAPAGAPDGKIDIADIAAVAVRVVSTCP